MSVRPGLLAAFLFLAGCRDQPEAPADAPRAPSEAPAAADPSMALREHCGDFVGFAFRCGIGKPAPDPTLDAAQQASANLIVWQSVSDLCSQGKPPFDEGLIGCFLSASGDCDRYRTCAENVVQARRAR